MLLILLRVSGFWMRSSQRLCGQRASATSKQGPQAFPIGLSLPPSPGSTACECAKLFRAGGLRGTTELQHTYVLTSHKPGIYSPAPNTNATMDTASVCKAIESPIKSHASLVVSPSRHGLRHP